MSFTNKNRADGYYPGQRVVCIGVLKEISECGKIVDGAPQRGKTYTIKDIIHDDDGILFIIFQKYKIA